MSISNDQIYKVLLDLRGDVGAVMAIAKNAHEFAAAVSKKADGIREEVNEHKKDPTAHLASIVGALIAGTASAIGIFKFFYN